MPEKSLNEIPRTLRELYEKGTAAIQRNNLDYAVAIFNQVLETEPAFFDARQALRATQFKKAGAKTGFFKRVLGTASNSPLLAKAQLQVRGNPLEAIKLSEQVLNTDPDNIAAHKLLAEAALEQDLPKTAVLSLEIALKTAPKDKEIALRLGHALAQAGQIARAEAIYADLQRAHPADSAISQTLKNLSARRTMSEGGYEALEGGEGSYRDILRDKKEAVSLEQENRQIKSSDVADRLIEEYEQRAKTDPNNSKILRSLADLHAQKKDWDRALSYYGQIAAAEGLNDPSLAKAITETTVRKFEQQIESMDPATPGYKEAVAKIQSEKEAYQLAQAQQRVENHPNDLQFRFELGQLYFQLGKLSEAIQEFQKAQHNPHRRVASLKFLGQCFARRGMFDLAARTLQNAIKEKLGFDDEKKDLIYSLGCVLEKMGKKAEAIDHFKSIYEVDIGYKDVAARVDAFYQDNP